MTHRNEIKSNSLKPEDALNCLRTLQQNLLLGKLLRHISIFLFCFHWHSKIWMEDFYHSLVSGCSSQYRHTKNSEILACTIFLPFLQFKQLLTTGYSNNIYYFISISTYFFIVSCILNITHPV